MNSMEENIILIIALIIGGVIGYFIAINSCNNSFEELKDLKIKYANLNDSYNQKIQENLVLRVENEKLKSQQKQLSQQITAYLLEQGSIDLLGLKKYTIIYDLTKITLCNINPSIVLC